MPLQADAPTPERSTDELTAALDDEQTASVDLAGGKAAALATLRAAGVDTLPGLVLTTTFCQDIDRGADLRDHPAIDEAWQRFTVDHDLGAPPLVARSSSVVEDADESSEAGQFESVVGIDDRDELVDAVRTVLDSRADAGADDLPIAVLVQPMVEPEVSGVLFGVDPVTGRTDRLLVTAVEGQPDRLVSGEVDGSRHLLDADGTAVDVDDDDGPALDDQRLRALADLARRAAEVFDGPQDVEWAVVDDRLVLLQSRPVTTEIRGVPSGPVYGPGPVAETFPEALAPLEADLWIPPLDDAVRRAMELAAATRSSALEGTPLVVVVDGRAAIDLEHTGEIEEQDRPPWHAVSARIRRLRSAWRVGRLRSALPALADRLLRRIDHDLESVPPLQELSERQLVALLGRGRMALRSLHAHEVLMGQLVEGSGTALTGASVAMRVLAEARSDGRPDDEIVATSPVVLALAPPRIGPRTELPDAAQTPDLPAGQGEQQPARSDADRSRVLREALRLRVRWVQEVTGRAAWRLGQSLERNGRLPAAEDVRMLTYDDLAAIVTRRADVVEHLLDQRREREQPSEQLPARFRISDRGRPIPERRGGSDGGTGAGGGRGRGVVTHDTDDPPSGAVLVVDTLTPGLGPLLPRLGGVVSETGSVLAHLAILAREAGVPTVVGCAGATDELAEGVEVLVDGDAGEVEIVDANDEQEEAS